MSSSQPDGKARKTVLIVDDNPINLHLLTSLLKANDYDARPAITGILALSTLKTSLPDLILLDIKMPEMNGYEVCRRLKAGERTREIPVIFISGLDQSIDKVRAFEAGAVDYITKPFQCDEVLARVKTHIELCSVRKHLEEVNRQLERSHEELERKVQERTAQLIAVNQQLKAEILDREQKEAQLKRVEETLSQRETRYRIVADNTYDWEYWISPEGRTLYSSPSCKRITGYSADAFLQDRDLLERIVHPEDRPHFNLHCQRVLEQKVPGENEMRIVRPDGSVRWIGHVCQPVFDDQERYLGIRGSNRDITESKRVEVALREKEEFIHNILDSVDVGFIVIGENLRILAANRAFCTAVNGSEDQVVGRPCHEVTHNNIVPCFESGEDCPVKRTFETGASQFATHAHTSPSGAKHYIELKSYPILDPLGRVAAVIETLNDVTEKARLEEQLRQAQKMESVGRLAGGVAHDFNNMLGVIMGHAELALTETDSRSSAYQHLQEILNATNRSSDLTRQLLAFARKQTISPRVLDINETVECLLKMIRRLIGEDMELVWRPYPEPWPVMMDPTQIHQILANLCVNSRDAITSVGRVVLETRNVVVDEVYCAIHPGFLPGEYVELAVSDDGCGMDTETLGNLFEPFFTTKGPGKGTGLGLATVYGIVKQNNGLINVTSELGHGSTFRIYLPRHAGQAVETPKESPGPAAARGEETILLVEDEPAVLEMGKIMLERLGYCVLTADRPTEAIRVAREHPSRIHLLITDVIMPEMDGLELAATMVTRYPELKWLFMSGHPSSVITREGVLDEGIDLLQKPFSMKSLAAHVRSALDGQ